jgi:hypothetical protein
MYDSQQLAGNLRLSAVGWKSYGSRYPEKLTVSSWLENL